MSKKIISILTIVFIISVFNLSNATNITKNTLETNNIIEEMNLNKTSNNIIGDINKNILNNNSIVEDMEEKEGKGVNIVDQEVRVYSSNPNTVPVEIINVDKDTKEPIQGNEFTILNLDYTIFKANLVTDIEGKVKFELDEEKEYYLKQNSVIEGYSLNKSLISIKLNGFNVANVNVENEKTSEEENITTITKEINIKEENKTINENNIKEVMNLKTTNINKEIVDTTNEVNWNNVNNFSNTKYKVNTTNYKKENTYDNTIPLKEQSEGNETIEGEKFKLSLEKQNYKNYMRYIMQESNNVPILPVASR